MPTWSPSDKAEMIFCNIASVSDILNQLISSRWVCLILQGEILDRVELFCPQTLLHRHYSIFLIGGRGVTISKQKALNLRNTLRVMYLN